ncbi:hypothetical protein HDA43_005456 [Streptosporangium sandarakinum]|uniref:Uncharacterized protein n=1 Tax=Streptosporangium sandarakinum TaxID=1260955 RepID=A0A852V432_9ACTN|nr:hypothetical protein [Streptosporangium sandarakinum]
MRRSKTIRPRDRRRRTIGTEPDLRTPSGRMLPY